MSKKVIDQWCECGHKQSEHSNRGCNMDRLIGGGPCHCIRFVPELDPGVVEARLKSEQQRHKRAPDHQGWDG